MCEIKVFYSMTLCVILYALSILRKMKGTKTAQHQPHFLDCRTLPLCKKAPFSKKEPQVHCFCTSFFCEWSNLGLISPSRIEESVFRSIEVKWYFYYFQLQIVHNARHHVYAHQPEVFNKIVNNVCDTADEQLLKNIPKSGTLLEPVQLETNIWPHIWCMKVHTYSTIKRGGYHGYRIIIYTGRTQKREKVPANGIRFSQTHAKSET